MEKPESVKENVLHKFFWDSDIKNESPNSAQKTKPSVD